jgi:predicted MFS family arabinose efflux permease
MLDRLPPTGYSTAGAVWSIAYDGGWGLGSVVFGLIVAHTGYPLAFGLTAGVVATAVVPAWSDRRGPEVQRSYEARNRHNDEKGE